MSVEATHLAQLDLEADPPSNEAQGGVVSRRRGPVAIVTLNRPEVLNALGLGSWDRLCGLFSEFGNDDTLRAVVIRGAGGRAFSAGADISEFRERRLTAADAVNYNRSIARALDLVMACPVPVIAMVGGLAVGGGCELAAACDVRICSDDSRFGVPIGRLGVTLGLSETRALVRLIGPGRLKELVFSGRLVDATEACEIGLVERVVSRQQLPTETRELVATIVGSSSATMRAAKLVTETWGRPLTPLDVEVLIRATIEAYDGADLKEGVAAFLERRSPSFRQPDAREE
jgi:enoyl-CoA hydratase